MALSKYWVYCVRSALFSSPFLIEEHQIVPETETSLSSNVEIFPDLKNRNEIREVDHELNMPTEAPSLIRLLCLLEYLS